MERAHKKNISITGEDFLWIAQIAFEVNCFEESLSYFKQFIYHNKNLDCSQGLLLVSIFKEILNEKRMQLRIIKEISHDTITTSNDNEIKLLDLLQQNIRQELVQLCNDLILLLDEYLIENAENQRSRTLFLKSKGEIYAYLGFYTRDGNQAYCMNKHQMLTNNVLSLQNLRQIHVIRFGLDLYINMPSLMQNIYKIIPELQKQVIRHLKKHLKQLIIYLRSIIKSPRQFSTQ